MGRKLLIRVDGNPDIGLGHVVRCLALAQMLNNEFAITFVSKSIPDGLINEIKKLNFIYLKIEEEVEILPLIEFGDVILIDHYNLGVDYHQFLKEKGAKVVCIDDIHDRVYDADLIINHSPKIRSQDYKVSTISQFALGLEYALLRPQFLKEACRETNKVESTLLICFGGSDPKNLTEVCTDISLKESFFKMIHVVIGSANKNYQYLKEKYESNPKVKLFYDLNEGEMIKVMQESLCCIVPSSGILLECIALSCKPISGMYIENQAQIFKNLLAVEAFISAGAFTEVELQNAIKQLTSSEKEAPKLIDGKSGQRIHKLFRNLANEIDMEMIEAEEDHLMLTYSWATDKIIRAHSFSQNEIKLEEHSSWFLKKIKAENCLYLIAKMREQLIGSIRFDMSNGQALISYLIDSQFHGKGYGINILKLGVEKLIQNKKGEISDIVGEVQPENISSIRCFERLGFQKKMEGRNFKFTLKIDK